MAAKSPPLSCSRDRIHRTYGQMTEAAPVRTRFRRQSGWTILRLAARRFTRGTGILQEGRRVRTSAAGSQRVKAEGDVTVTTIGAATVRHTRKPVSIVALAALLGTGLAGCETANNILGNNANAPAAAIAQAPAATAIAPKPSRTIALAPVIGAPDPVASQLSTQMTTALSKRGVGTAAPGGSSDYTLRGYIVAAKETAGTKVSYIWDVTDVAGKRVNRITGEDLVPGSQAAKDPWSTVTPQLMQTIAERTATSLAAWLPAQQGASAAVAQANTVAPSAAGAPVQQVASATRVAAATAAGPTAGSIAGGSLAAIVPSVAGAPGDGPTSLSNALQRELRQSGIQLASASAASSAHRVEGRVAVGGNRNGKQPIQIEWDVKDPAGKRLGTVTQKNEIPAGSLDGAWGQTADAAAAAAAQGIIKLLREKGETKTN